MDIEIVINKLSLNIILNPSAFNHQIIHPHCSKVSSEEAKSLTSTWIFMFYTSTDNTNTAAKFTSGYKFKQLVIH